MNWRENDGEDGRHTDEGERGGWTLNTAKLYLMCQLEGSIRVLLHVAFG